MSKKAIDGIKNMLKQIAIGFLISFWLLVIFGIAFLFR